MLNKLKLFNLLINEKYSTDLKAEKFITAILEAHGKIQYKTLQREKYNLIKEIRDSYDEKDFFNTKINNYNFPSYIKMIEEMKDWIDNNNIYK